MADFSEIRLKFAPKFLTETGRMVHWRKKFQALLKASARRRAIKRVKALITKHISRLGYVFYLYPELLFYAQYDVLYRALADRLVVVDEFLDLSVGYESI